MRGHVVGQRNPRPVALLDVYSLAQQSGSVRRLAHSQQSVRRGYPTLSPDYGRLLIVPLRQRPSSTVSAED